MKTLFCHLLPVAGLAVMLPALQAADPGPGSAMHEQKQLRVLVGPDAGSGNMHFFHAGGPREMENVTFLGVETRPTDPTLADQLGLPAGTGLIVRVIAPDSPAATALKANDVLVKLDDQLLIEARQLAVLIRNHKEGDEVTLTFIRVGKETTAKVKLGKHEAPKLVFNTGEHGFNEVFNVPFGPDQLPGAGPEEMDRVLSLIQRGPADEPGQPKRQIRIQRQATTPGMHTTTVSTANTNMVFTDDAGSLELTTKDGHKTLVAKNAKGDQVFSGPVTTPEERKAMPADVRERLEKLEGMQEFSFQTDEDFQGSKVEMAPPTKSKIAMPLPSEPPAAPRAQVF